MKKALLALAALIVTLAAYLLLWPVPIEPQLWAPKPSPGYSGPHEANTKLAGLKLIDIGREVGPEHVMIGPDGKLYAAVASGAVLRMSPEGTGQEVFASTGGRVLGFDFDAQGRLIAADAMRGLLAIGADRKIEVLSDRVDGDPIRYADAVVVARGSGKIYFSDASTRFGAKDWGGTFNASVLDILEQSFSGRILEYDPATRATRVVARGLAFANGVALSADEQSLFVAETGVYRIWKIALAANNLDLRQGPGPQARVLLDNLPGYPDNLMRGLPGPDGQGRIWAGLVKPRNPKAEAMADKPWLRKLTLRLPRALWPIPPAYGHVFAFTEDGRIVADLQDPSGAYPETTAVTETADRLYIQSLHANVLGWMPRKP